MADKKTSFDELWPEEEAILKQGLEQSRRAKRERLDKDKNMKRHFSFTEEKILRDGLKEEKDDKK
jgi:hypothetical protein